jgi:hypothetical protein
VPVSPPHSAAFGREQHAPAREQDRARLDDGLFIACGLAWAAGLIHILAAIQHVDEYVLFAIFFALLAPAQFAWGAALYRRPGRKLLIVGAAGCLMVAALWVASRTTGLPIGPDPWTPEPVGPIDALATADEVALVLVAAIQLARPARGALGRWCRYLVLGVGTCLILFSSLALVLGGHAH